VPQLRLDREPVRGRLRDLRRGPGRGPPGAGAPPRGAAALTAPGWFPEITTADAVLVGLLIICAFAAPLIGGPIAGLFAYFAHEKGDVVQRNLALAAVALALIVVIVISFLPGTWDLLLPWVNLQGPLPT
jgi:hypothetical protein